MEWPTKNQGPEGWGKRANGRRAAFPLRNNPDQVQAGDINCLVHISGWLRHIKGECTSPSRWMTDADGGRAARIERVSFHIVPGMPSIYPGDEAGLLLELPPRVFDYGRAIVRFLATRWRRVMWGCKHSEERRE
jgi:hypothetical protein